MTESVDTGDQITGHRCLPTSSLPPYELLIIGHLGDQLTSAREEKSASAAPEQLQMEVNATRRPVPHATSPLNESGGNYTKGRENHE